MRLTLATLALLLALATRTPGAAQRYVSVPESRCRVQQVSSVLSVTVCNLSELAR